MFVTSLNIRLTAAIFIGVFVLRGTHSVDLGLAALMFSFFIIPRQRLS
jgi:hypothetical protein